MDLRILRSFMAVAEEKSFTRAAQRLNIAQPPLSRQIQQLEAEFGASLFDRSSRPLSLTPTGKLVFDQAQALLNQVNVMHDTIIRAINTEKRPFSVGFVSSIMFTRLPSIIRDFRQSTQNIELTLTELVTMEQIEALKDGRIDVGFGRLRIEDSAIRRVVMRNERLIVALPERYAPADLHTSLSLHEVARWPLILYPRQPRPSYLDQVQALLHDYDIIPRTVYEVRELQIAIGLVAAEEGVCIVPDSVRRLQVEGVRYYELAEDAFSPIIMSYRARDNSSELISMIESLSRLYSQWGYDIPGPLRLSESTRS